LHPHEVITFEGDSGIRAKKNHTVLFQEPFERVEDITASFVVLCEGEKLRSF
jgi:hypothetical protein